MPRPTIQLAVLVALIAAPALPAEAKHRPPITKTFQVRGTVPFPSGGGMCDPSPHDLEAQVIEASLPEAGKLLVELTDFYGDFDMVLTDAKGTFLSSSNNESGTSGGNPSTGDTVETMTYTAKKAVVVKIVACNYLASPDANGKWTFTYAK